MWFTQTFVLIDYANRSVFGDKHNMWDDTSQDEDDAVALVAEQRAMRQQAAATQSASDAQQPQAPGSQLVSAAQQPQLPESQLVLAAQQTE